MTQFTLQLCSDDLAWEAFNEGSPHGSAFTSSCFLASMPNEVSRWFLLEGKEIVAAAIVLTRDSKVLQAPQPFSPYQGILLSSEVCRQSPHSKSKRVLEILSAMMPLLLEKHSSLSFCLHPCFEDLRGLQWHNYHGEPEEKFQFGLSYTGIVNLADHASFDDFLKVIRNTRRQEYQKAIRNGLRSEVSTDLSLLRSLEEKTFERQGIQLQESMIASLIHYCRAMQERGSGRMLLCRNEEGEPVSATFFLRFRDQAYYLVGANDPELRKLNGGTFLMLENLRMLFSEGVKSVDMVGINSPNRGDFKTSFNANPVSYHTASLGFGGGQRRQ